MDDYSKLPNLMSEHYSRGLVLLEAGQSDQATREFHLAISEDPDSPYAYSLLALCQLQVQPKESLEFAKKGVALDPENGHGHYVLALAFWSNGKMVMAETEFIRSLAIDPYDDTTHEFFARFLGAQGRWNDALVEINRALECDSESSDAHAFRGKILTVLKRREEAEDALTTSLRIDPGHTEAITLQAGLALRKGDHSSATERYQDSLRLDPTDQLARKGLLDSMRSRYRFFRIVLGYTNWLESLPTSTRQFMFWGIFLFLQIGRFRKQFPVLETTGGKILLGVLVLFYWWMLVTIWIVPTIVDGLVSFHKDAYKVLGRWERFSSRVVFIHFAIAFIAGIALLIANAFSLHGISSLALICIPTAVATAILSLIRQAITSSAWLRGFLFHSMNLLLSALAIFGLISLLIGKK